MNAYNESQAILVQDLINTFDLYLEQPEHLQEPEDLRSFLADHQIGLSSPITPAMLEQVRVLREELRMVWTAEKSADMATALNTLLAQTAVLVQVEADDHLHMQFTLPSDASLVQRLAFACAMGVIAVMRKYGRERMRACASAPCRDVFVDVSRNKTRRFCSDRCANRYNIAAFRDRQKSGDVDQH